MSDSLSAERDRIQRQVEELTQNLSVTQEELELLSSETDDESSGDDPDLEGGQSAAGLLAQREKIQREIQSLESALGPHSPICVSGDDDGGDDDDDSSCSEESELDLSPSADSCLQMNLVYQQVIQETLDQLENLLTLNQKQQQEALSQLCGPTKEAPKVRGPPSSYEQSDKMFLGRFLKPYFKDKLTGLGPPANQETKEKTARMTGCLDGIQVKVKRWESWQKTLLIHSISRDTLRRLIQPKLSKIDYLSKKMSSADETDRDHLQQQIENLEKEIDMLQKKKEDELTGEQFDEHDWQKIANVDFEGIRSAEDLQRFWQCFLHPSINKCSWSEEEVQQLREITAQYGERDWENIASELGTGRTAYMCLQTYQNFISESFKRRNWTPAEDALFRELVDKMRIGNFIPYTQISYFMEGRDPSQLIYRWTQVLDPSLRKGPWTKKEDELLLKAVSHYGEKDWWKIRLEVPGRSDGACRDRYLDCLKADIKKTPFDAQERKLLLQLVEKHGVGRWAKIAAEIPNRYDAQCLRMWKKMCKEFHDQKQSKARKSSASSRKRQRTKSKSRTKKSVMKIEEESTSEEQETEDEETGVTYTDSDGDEKNVRKEKEMKKETLAEEVEEEHIIPPLQTWIPDKKVECSAFPSFQPVELPSTGEDKDVNVRSTIIGKFGRSVIIGPRPREVPLYDRHNSRTMMMVTADKLRTYLARQAVKHTQRIIATKEQPEACKQVCFSRVTETGLIFHLQGAVVSWIGNLLIPAKSRVTAADVLREKAEKRQITSTSVFLLFLQTMNVDAGGCKEMIEQRRNRMRPSTAFPHNYPAIRPKIVSRALQQRAVKNDLEFDPKHKVILEQFHALQTQRQQQPLLNNLQNMQQGFYPNHPGILVHMRPNMHPKVSFVPGLVTQPIAASIQYMPPPSTTTHPLALCISPPAPQRMNAPALPVIVMPPRTTPPSTAPSVKQVIPVPSSPALNVSIGLSSSCSVSSSSPSEKSRLSGTGVQDVFSGSTIGEDTEGKDNSGSSTGEDKMVSKDGRRIRKPTQKAKALQESEAMAKSERQSASAPRKQGHTKPRKCLSQGVSTVPVEVVPQTSPSTPSTPITDEGAPLTFSSPDNKTEAPLTPPLREVVPPVLRTLTQDAQEDTSASSTEKVPSALLPLEQTCQVSYIAALIDHDYSSKLPCPTPNKNKCYPKMRRRKRFTNKRSKPKGSIPKKPIVLPPKKRKWVEEKMDMEKSDAVIATGEATHSKAVPESGKDNVLSSPEVVQVGKRIRKPSFKAKALQEDNEVEAQGKKKRSSSSSSPRNKSPCKSKGKQKDIMQEQPETPVRGLLLLTLAQAAQMAKSPPPGCKLPIPRRPKTPHRNTLVSSPAMPSFHLIPSQPSIVSIPVNLPGLRQPCLPLTPPTYSPGPLPPNAFLKPAQIPARFPQPSSPAVPTSPRKENLQFDTSLMFFEPKSEVQDWLNGTRGVAVPGAGVALPYLPPFASSLSTLTALLKSKKSLSKLTMQLFDQESMPQPQPNKTTDKADRSNKGRISQSKDLPDSTTDLRPASPSVRPGSLNVEAEEEKHVTAVRQLVAQRFSGNPAYQLLKARFLSCFTLPALLATLQPVNVKSVAATTTEEEDREEKEDEEEMKTVKEKIKNIVRKKRTEKSSLLHDGPEPPASHFSGM